VEQISTILVKVPEGLWWKLFGYFGASSLGFRSKLFGDFRGYLAIFQSKFVGVLVTTRN